MAETVTSAQRNLDPHAVAEAAFATGKGAPAPPFASYDPADRLEFSRPSDAGILRFDSRSDAELRDAMRGHSSAMERERAMWEYGDRVGVAAVEEIAAVAAREETTAVRYGALWLLQKVGGERAADIIAQSMADAHPEVRDWARLLVREITGRSTGGEARPARVDPSNPFDQTLPLMIAGHARVLVPSMGWVQATLSPLWFEAILGRVMACTCDDTFNSRLIIEKRVADYHPDGSAHYEIFKFLGFTQEIAQDVFCHIYQAQATHPFYPSGRVEDDSVAPLDNVKVNANRIAVTARVQLPDVPDRRVVKSVRGRYYGEAFTDLRRIMGRGLPLTIEPGEVQLSSTHHPIAGPMTNTFLFGTFKGKLSDLDGDGYLDVNTERCHGTLDGDLDYDLDGRADRDPYDACHPV